MQLCVLRRGLPMLWAHGASKSWSAQTSACAMRVILHAQLLHAGSPSLACTSMWLFLQLLIPC